MRIQDLRSSKWAFHIVLPLALAAILLVLVLGLVTAKGTGNLTRITTASDSDRDSRGASLSGDGVVAAFESDSDFLGQGIADDQYEIWLYNTMRMTFTRVTTASDSDRDSGRACLSADGKMVALESDSDFLGQGIPDDQFEIWLYDTTTMTYTRVTTASDANRDSRGASLSADGTRVAFHSDSDFLGQGNPDDQFEIWLYDTTTMTYTRVTTASDSNRYSLWPSLSADGTRVAFRGDADLLGQGIPPGQNEVWLYDTTTMTLTRVTTASDSNRDSRYPSLSADGKIIAFGSDSDFLDQGIPDDQQEIWLYDTAAMTLTRITTASGSNRVSSSPALNADGGFIAFQSDSDFLGQGIPAGQFEIWLYDTTTMTFTRVTMASDSDRDSFDSSLSADGRFIVFQSDSDFLSQGIPANQWEIWLYRREYRVYLPLVSKQFQ